ncbi:MAG: EFR1 family ferrodoxin [Bacilli bacterium]|nr:EFR1 family ferrodoxin [Bacilli bacterium]
MKCLLIYYTGTYNTRYLTGLLKERLVKEGVEVDTYEIDALNMERLDFTGYDLVGLGYPIYGFNAPSRFLKFVRKQEFPKGIKTFIYKNSGETYHANDASSVSVVRKLRRCKAEINNEYHFIMPYNIHFKFDDALVSEMLTIDDMLLDILVKEVLQGIPNIKKYKILHKIITFFVKLQYIGGDINSFFYRIKKDKCVNCNKCINACPTKNIYRNKKGAIKFHHDCLMCMRCSMNCPTDAIYIGFLDAWGWRVNGAYDFKKIRAIKNEEPVIKDNTTGFFKCYIETYRTIKQRHEELFNDQ